jgi:hypothetical protein
LKADGEPAIVALQSAIIARRVVPSKTQPVNPPAYDPQANGAIEKGMQDFFVSLRKLKIGFIKRIKANIPEKHP